MKVLEEFQGTSLLVSHNRDEVYRISDHIAVMADGHVDCFDEKKRIFEEDVYKRQEYGTSRCVARTDEKEIDDAFSVDDRLDVRIFQYRFDFRGEQESIIFQSVKERFDAHAVPGEKKGSFRIFPDGESEDAVKPAEAFFSPADI